MHCLLPSTGHGLWVSDSKELGLAVLELEVPGLMVDGLSKREILERLTITIDTVKTHVKRILAKFCASDRTPSCVKAYEII